MRHYDEGYYKSYCERSLSEVAVRVTMRGYYGVTMRHKNHALQKE